MNATETLARQMARAYACKLAAYCFMTKILPAPESPAAWTKRLNQYVDDYWWDYLPEAEKINGQQVVARVGSFEPTDGR